MNLNLGAISDRFVDVSGILINSGQIGVGVGKGWIDLNGAQIARNGVVQITHFLQRVPHVGVRVRECRVNSGVWKKRYNQWLNNKKVSSVEWN